MNELRICRKCEVSKDLESNFYLYGNRGLRRKICNKCYSDRIKKTRYSTEECVLRQKYRSRAYTLKKYGFKLEDYENLFKEQKGKCKICGLTSNKTLNIDHCHITNKVRGLLCWKCNMALGYFKDSVDNLEQAIKYLNSV